MSRLLEEPYSSIRVSETLALRSNVILMICLNRLASRKNLDLARRRPRPGGLPNCWGEGGRKLTETILQEIETLTGSLPRPTAPSMEITPEAAQEMPNEIPADAAPSQEPEIVEQPMHPIEPDVATAPPEPSVPPEPMAEATDLPDIDEVPTEGLSAEMPSPDMAAAPEFAAKPVSENEMTDETETSSERMNDITLRRYQWPMITTIYN